MKSTTINAAVDTIEVSLMKRTDTECDQCRARARAWLTAGSRRFKLCNEHTGRALTHFATAHNLH